ncbi:MAG: hypothetical protein ACKVTZ_15765 [Bacteroidia bacterium]
MNNITGNENIVIQNVSDSTITVSVNGGVPFEIQYLLTELKALLERHQASSFQLANTIYNIDSINEVNFGTVLRKRIFNTVLTKKLMEILPQKEKVTTFFQDIAKEDKENWAYVRKHAKEAQNLIQESFVWIIAWELRRLFSIGSETKDEKGEYKQIEERVESYMQHCFSTYRFALYLINAVFLSKLWDEKKRNPQLQTDLLPIKIFLMASIQRNLGELRELFETLLKAFTKEQLAFPFHLEAANFAAYFDKNSTFYQACLALEKLERIQNEEVSYSITQCQLAEKYLADILTHFPFLAQHQLVSMKKVEYEQVRNQSERYIKNYQVLGQRSKENSTHTLKYDDKPSLTYVIFFLSPKYAINLFPLILDYNALTNDTDFQLLVYENRKENELQYVCVNNEKEMPIPHEAVEDKIQVFQDEKEKAEYEKKVKFAIVSRQYQDLVKTLLGIEVIFAPIKNDADTFDL